jgi:hypothetical protein
VQRAASLNISPVAGGQFLRQFLGNRLQQVADGPRLVGGLCLAVAGVATPAAPALLRRCGNQLVLGQRARAVRASRSVPAGPSALAARGKGHQVAGLRCNSVAAA